MGIDYFLSLSKWDLIMNIITTMLVYIFVPLILRLRKGEPYDKKKANTIAIINSIVIAVIFFILRESSGELENNTLSNSTIFLYWIVNYNLLLSKIKPKNNLYILMFFSFVASFTSCFSAVLLLGPISFVFAMIGLGMTKKGQKWQKVLLYIEAFLGLFLFLSFLHSLFFDFGIMYVWGFIYALVLMVILNLKEILICFSGSADELDKSNDEEIEKDSDVAKNSDTDSLKIKTIFCKKCGGKLDVNKKCKKCGKQYFKLGRNVVLYVIMSILLILTGIFGFLYFDLRNTVSDIAETCSTGSEWCEAQLDVLTGEHSWLYVSDKLDFFDENIVFVLEGYGDYYYSYDCIEKITNGSDYSYWAYNKEQAIGKGYIKGYCN